MPRCGSKVTTLEERLDALEAKQRERDFDDEHTATNLPELDALVQEINTRVTVLEMDQRELAEALLGYLRADMATPWLGSAKKLEEVLLKMLASY